MPGGIGYQKQDKYAWVTTAWDEDSVIKAAALAKSLARVITVADIVVLFGNKLPTKYWHLLAECVDSIIRVRSEDSGFNVMRVFELDINLEAYKKVAVLNPNTLILQNCDELFKLEKDYYFPGMLDRVNSLLPSILLVCPKSECYRKIYELKRAPEFKVADILTDSCADLPKDAIGKLPETFNLHVDDLKNTKARLLKNIKVISHGLSSKNETNDSRSTQGIIDLWNGCWDEIQNILLNKPDGPIPPEPTEKEKEKNQKYLNKEGVAIVGYSCRFAEANDNDEYWKLLESGGEAIKETPTERVELAKLDLEKFEKFKAGFLKCAIDEFDADFFGISPEDAVVMDPQHRLALEVAWEALENAGINPLSLKGGNAALFPACWKSEYGGADRDGSEKKVKEEILAEIAKFFGLISNEDKRFHHIAPYSGCSMFALHLGWRNLRRKDTDLSLVMGMNILEMVEREPKRKTKDSLAKTLDENPKGFIRGEGIAAMVLKRLPDAVANGDRIMGIVRGSDVNNTTPTFGNHIAQKLTIRYALEYSGVKPEEVDYIEFHGIGSAPEDATEFRSFSETYAASRPNPLIIGSNKPNIGHTESAAGLASAIKIAMAFKNERIPPHKNYISSKGKTHLEKIPAVVPSECQSWKRDDSRVRIAAADSCGLGTFNVHVLIQEPPREDQFPQIKISVLESDRTHHILNLSAKTEKALEDLINSYVRFLEINPKIDIGDLTFTANKGRAHFTSRASVVGKDIPEIQEALKNKTYSLPVIKEKPFTAFLFSGQGSEYSGMGNSLYKSNSAFRDAFDECSAIIQKKIGIVLEGVLWGAKKESTDKPWDDYVSCQLSTFSIEYSLMTLWFSLDVKPDFVLGYGVGEYVAAVCSGIIDLETALDFLIKKIQLIAKATPCPLLAIRCSVQKTLSLMSKYRSENKNDWLELFSVNSPLEAVVVGTKETIEKFQKNCKTNKIVFKMLPLSYAFRSRDIDTSLNPFTKTKPKIKCETPVCNFVSGTTGAILGKDAIENGKYWLRLEKEIIDFKKGMFTLIECNCTVFIEIGPRSVLDFGMECVNSVENFLWLPTIENKKEDWEVFLNSLAKLYTNGMEIDWDLIDEYKNRKKLELPTYPFQREKYWTNCISTKEILYNPFLGNRVPLESGNEIKFIKDLMLKDFAYLSDHQVAHLVIMPGAGFLEIILEAGKVLLQTDTPDCQLQVTNFVIQAALELEEEKSYKMEIVALPKEDSGFSVTVSVFSESNGWKKHASGNVSLIQGEGPDFGIEDTKIIQARCPNERPTDKFYKTIYNRGIQFGETFTTVKSIWEADNEFFITITQNWETKELHGYVFHPILLDAMIQSVVLTLDISSGLRLPIGIDKSYYLGGKVSNLLSAHVRKSDEGVKVLLYNEDNDLIFVMDGVKTIPTTSESFLKIIRPQNN